MLSYSSQAIIFLFLIIYCFASFLTFLLVSLGSWRNHFFQLISSAWALKKLHWEITLISLFPECVFALFSYVWPIAITQLSET